MPRGTTTYPPQITYEGGGLMCGSAATQWVILCLQGMLPTCTEQQMDDIMLRARNMHLQICLRLGGPGAVPYMLQQHEVLDNCEDLPDGLRRTELFGTASEETLWQGMFMSMSDCISLRSLPAKIRPSSGMLFTAGGHTSAVFRDAAGTFFVFDSAVASVEHVSVEHELVRALNTAHYTVQDFHATLLSFDVAAPSPLTGNVNTAAGGSSASVPIINRNDPLDGCACLNLGAPVPQAHPLDEAHSDDTTANPTMMEGVEQHDRSCNDLEEYLDSIKEKDGTVAMSTRKGTELCYSHASTVNMFKKPDAKLRGAIRADDPALTQQGIRDHLVALVPTKDGVAKAAEQYCACDRVKKSSAGLFHYLRDCLDFCEHAKFRKSCYQCAPHNFCPAGRMHRNGNRKRKSQCDEKCCSKAKISKHH